MIVPHHVYLALSDLEQKVEELKKEAQRRGEATVDAEECGWWAAYGYGVSDTLDLIRETVNHI